MNSNSQIGAVNWIGLWTLLKREVWRFMKVWNQTLFAPIITTLLFLSIFNLAMGGSVRVVDGMPFSAFITPGLIMMAIVQNAFANTSSSLMLSKVQGVIVDILMPPFSASELMVGLIGGGIVRGVLVGISVSLAMWIFVPFEVHHWGILLFYVLAASLMLALLGMLTGVWAQTFDQMAAITNYVITPLSFLSGTFYSVKQLPGVWHTISHYNPFFYMIDGIRYAMTDYADGSITTGMLMLLGTNLVLWCLAQSMIARGYRLKT